MLKFFLLCFDYFAAMAAWGLFYSYRKLYIEHTDLNFSTHFFLGIFIIPVFWLILYFFQGTYHHVKRLYRMKILNLTASGTLIGTIVLFFAFILDDIIDTYKEYYLSFLGLFVIHFSITFLFRFFIINGHINRIRSGKVGFRTLLIGGGENALHIYEEISSLAHKSGNIFVGYIQSNGTDNQLATKLKKVGELSELRTIIDMQEIDEVLIAPEKIDHAKLIEIVSRIYASNVVIKVLPDMYDILSGSVKMHNIFGVLLAEIDKETMPYWQIQVKRLLDILLSLLALIILLPFYIILGLVVKFTSKGPIFFLQERIGLNGKPFKIIKFRTMYVDSEKTGPQLSSDHDPRITKSGRIFRKLRLDELPQFFNVLKGDMSLVGPRPERQYFIEKIIEKEPHYLYLNSVRPGITSWGQVKFGYAENVNQMIQRMKYDLLYLRNRSLALDFKILILTVVTVLKAKGK